MKIYEKTSFYFQRYFLIFLILVAIEYSGQYSIKHLTRNIHDDKNTGQSNNFLQKSKKKERKRETNFSNNLAIIPRNFEEGTRRWRNLLARASSFYLTHRPPFPSTVHQSFRFRETFLFENYDWSFRCVRPCLARTPACFVPFLMFPVELFKQRSFTRSFRPSHGV